MKTGPPMRAVTMPMGASPVTRRRPTISQKQRNPPPASGGDVRDLVLDRRAGHHGVAGPVGGQTGGSGIGQHAPVLGHDHDAQAGQLVADGPAFSLVEGPVAAGGQAAGQGVQLGQRAHAAAADSGEVQPGTRVGPDLRIRGRPGCLRR